VLGTIEKSVSVYVEKLVKWTTYYKWHRKSGSSIILH